MKNLSKKSQETLERLERKANAKVYESSRMPNLNKVSELLNEVGIQNSCLETSCEKWTKGGGNRYYTGGGSKTYNGFLLRVPEIRMNVNSTDTYYSYNTWSYAGDLVKLVNEKL